MEAFAVRFLRSTATVFLTSPVVKRLYVHSRQGLVMVALLNNFLDPLKVFIAVESDFTKSL
jgi:hypothetical protein